MFNFLYAHCHLNACKWTKWEIMFQSEQSKPTIDRFWNDKILLELLSQWKQQRNEWNGDHQYGGKIWIFIAIDVDFPVSLMLGTKGEIYKYFSNIFFLKCSQSHAKVKLCFYFAVILLWKKNITEPRINAHVFVVDLLFFFSIENTITIWVVREIVQRSSVKSTSRISYMYDSVHSYTTHTHTKQSHTFFYYLHGTLDPGRVFLFILIGHTNSDLLSISDYRLK